MELRIWGESGVHCREQSRRTAKAARAALEEHREALGLSAPPSFAGAGDGGGVLAQDDSRDKTFAKGIEICLSGLRKMEDATEDGFLIPKPAEDKGGDDKAPK